MISTNDVLEFLEGVFTEIPYEAWGVNYIDINKPQQIGVYSRRNGRVQPTTVGSKPAGWGIKSITLLVHWGESSVACEQKALDIFKRLNSLETNLAIGGKSCWIMARQAPVMIGKDDNGKYWQCVIDLDVYFRKG